LKGALITHTDLMAILSASRAHGKGVQPFDSHISYLPLSHIFERVVAINMAFANGGSVGFSRGNKTLLIEDIVAKRPTQLPVAPRVLNKIHDKVNSVIE
ncbi:MAG: AMP-binding protein, partial [Gloeomargaritales cyanobacterium]